MSFRNKYTSGSVFPDGPVPGDFHKDISGQWWIWCDETEFDDEGWDMSPGPKGDVIITEITMGSFLHRDLGSPIPFMPVSSKSIIYSHGDGVIEDDAEIFMVGPPGGQTNMTVESILKSFLETATDEEVDTAMSKSNTKAVRVDDDVYGIIKAYADRNGVTVRAALRTLVLNDASEHEEDGVELPEGHWGREDSDPIGDIKAAAEGIKGMTPIATIEDEPF